MSHRPKSLWTGFACVCMDSVLLQTTIAPSTSFSSYSISLWSCWASSAPESQSLIHQTRETIGGTAAWPEQLHPGAAKHENNWTFSVFTHCSDWIKWLVKTGSASVTGHFMIIINIVLNNMQNDCYFKYYATSGLLIREVCVQSKSGRTPKWKMAGCKLWSWW